MNLSKLFRSFRYAFAGFGHILRKHQNIRFHIVMAIVAIIIAYLLNISYLEYLFVLITIFFVIICEMMNTAIEEMTDLITKEHRREAMIAKDVAAAAVFLSAVFAVIVAVMVFAPKVLELLFH